MQKIEKYENHYCFSEFIKTGISFVFTKLFWKKAKIIRYPVYIRGKKNMEYEEEFNIGYNCRFDLLVKGKKTLHIGKNCNLGNYNHISALNEVVIGDDFLSGDYVYIGDNSHGLYRTIGGEMQSSPDEAPANRIVYASRVKIGNNVWIGEHSSILPGSIIGDGCIIGANSVVNGSIPNNTIAVGSPAKVVKKYDEGLKRWISQ